MNTKKLVLMMVIGLGAAFAAQADLLLYFKVSAFAWTGGPKYFDYACVGVAYNGVAGYDYLKIQLDPYTPSENDVIVSEDRYNAVGWAKILDEYKTDEYTFYVETCEDDGTGTGTGKWNDPVYTYSKDTAKTYAQLKEQGSIYDTTSGTDPSDVKPWNVPEPTSGMLLLLGSALLALKRKRA